jgi:hypothetical protein
LSEALSPVLVEVIRRFEVACRYRGESAAVHRHGDWRAGLGDPETLGYMHPLAPLHITYLFITVAHKSSALSKPRKDRWHRCPHLCFLRLYGLSIDGAQSAPYTNFSRQGKPLPAGFLGGQNKVPGSMSRVRSIRARGGGDQVWRTCCRAASKGGRP